jgi:hypothetical protein
MRVVAVLLGLVVAACSGANTPTTASSDQNLDSDGGICRYPAGVAIGSSVSGSECVAHPPGQICQVSNGATVNAADGAVTGGSETCHSLCGSSEYEMTCSETPPDSSLGCKIIPIPTPSCCAFYCCPCSD